MIGTRAVLKDFACINCRLRLMNAFVSASGLSFRPIATTSFSKPAAVHRSSPRQLRRLGTVQSDNSNSVDAQRHEITESEGSQEFQENEASDDPPQQEDSTPWYLQVETPDQETTSSLLQRQRLPELPPDPPPLLQPMLEHIFLELGIDDLMLFDLRKLDPPPALGANLIMIIGTARSEKHLHVSADRFCRYMKTAHKIAPYADGLLGRGELKLKLKRKARRARILSRVGSADTSKTDDGIRTGWICVTVSNIDDGKPAEEAPKLPDDYVGFGEVEHGANVVIQMLTQEKREELDLEDLWGKTLRRYERKQDRIARGIEGPDPEDEVGSDHTHDEGQTADFSPVMPSSSSMRSISIPNEIHHPHNATLRGVRGFSTLHRRYHETAAISESGSMAPPPYLVVNQGVEKAIADDFIAALPTRCEEQVRSICGTDAETLRLKAHLNYAYSLSPQNARAILGTGAEDNSSTPFLQSFHAALPLFPSAKQWAIRLSLVILGIKKTVPGYTKTALADLFQELQSSHIHIPASAYIDTITTLLKPSPSRDPSLRPYISQEIIHAAVCILDDMLFRGHPLPPYSPKHNDVLSLLCLAVLSSHPPFCSSSLSRFYRLLPTPVPLSLEIARLHACTLHSDFKTMWRIWHSFPTKLRSRPVELYVAMLKAAAGTRHQARCAEVLRELVEDMGREDPAVLLEDVVDEVRDCLVVVWPPLERGLVDVEDEDEDEEEREAGEWEKLWAKCEWAVLERGRWAREMDDD